MSRALTVYSKKRDEDTPEITAQLERVMSSTGCSEPVARNLLKYGKLGIGPLAQPQAHEREGERHVFRDRPRQSPPRQLERTAASAMAEKKRKLREQEERLREQEEQRERELEEEEKARRDARKHAGLTRLGPVLARQEEVDPLQQVQVEAAFLPGGEEEEDSGDEKTVLERAFLDPAKLKAEKKRGQAEPAARKAGKKKRRRRRGGLASEGSSDEVAGEAEEAPAEDPERAGRGRESASSAGGGASSLMTEAQVLEMMGKDRKTKRGSLRAKSRIQREMEEWESAKRENPEFWKAPKFSLCYSAETRKSRNY